MLCWSMRLQCPTSVLLRKGRRVREKGEGERTSQERSTVRGDSEKPTPEQTHSTQYVCVLPPALQSKSEREGGERDTEVSHKRSTVRGDSESRPLSKHTAHCMFVYVLLHSSLLCSCVLQIACYAALDNAITRTCCAALSDAASAGGISCSSQ